MPYFVWTDAHHVVLIEWKPDSSGSGIHGTVRIDSITSTAPGESVSVRRDPFTGTISYGSVALTISFDGGVYGTATLDGSLTGSTLTITSFSSLLANGFADASLQQSSRAAYNAAAAVLRSTVRKDNAQASAE